MKITPKKFFEFIVFMSCFLVLLALVIARMTTTKAIEAQQAAAEQATEPTVIVTEALTPEQIEMTEVELLARVVWGEARGCDKTQQAAVVWCVLNRVDAGYGSIYEVVTAPGQFSGWNVHNPVITSMQEIVIDVLTRWNAEKVCIGDVGRVLPKEYIYFTGNGEVNLYRKDYNDYNHMWDWSLPNPYEE